MSQKLRTCSYLLQKGNAQSLEIDYLVCDGLIVFKKHWNFNQPIRLRTPKFLSNQIIKKRKHKK